MPDVIPYALRHSSIVRGLKANLPIRLVAALHDTSVQMIERHYAKWIADGLEELAAQALVPLLPLEPGQVAGRDADADRAGPPVPGEGPPVQRVHQREAGRPPQQRGAQRQHLGGALGGAALRRLQARVVEGHRAGVDQPAPRVGLVDVRGGQRGVEVPDLGVVVPQAAQRCGHPAQVDLRQVLDPHRGPAAR